MKQARTARWLRRWSAGFLCSLVLLSAAAGAAGVRGTHVLVGGQAKFLVETAIAGAKKRLGHPACAGLLTEFQASDGVPLAAHVSDLSLTPPEFLSSLWFADADDLRRCHVAGGPIAFTAPGHHVVFICGEHFVRTFQRSPSYAEIVVIHEMLHAAGLGENPPTSEHISQITLARCASA